MRAAADAEGRAVGILADLQGPKIRLGNFADGPQTWATGETVRITTDDVEGTHDRVSTTYPGLADDVRPGESLLIDDGNVSLEVTDVEGRDVVCRVVEGGRVSDHKGISLPGTVVSVPAMSEKDEADLRFALGLRVDMIALSFVRSPADAELVHKIMDEYDARLPVIAKLEKPEAVDALEAIVLAFDAIMVARGDLGVELALEDVPLVQKRAVQIARENAKPVIVATQMLESMIHNYRPDPRGGLRRRQRRARRRRRGDALRRDLGRATTRSRRCRRWPASSRRSSPARRRCPRSSTCRGPSAGS